MGKRLLACLVCLALFAFSAVPTGADSESVLWELRGCSAVYAYRLYEMRGSDVTSFTAGDVKITSSAGGKGGAEALWQEQKKLCSDILRAENFLFGRM